MECWIWHRAWSNEPPSPERTKETQTGSSRNERWVVSGSPSQPGVSPRAGHKPAARSPGAHRRRWEDHRARTSLAAHAGRLRWYHRGMTHRCLTIAAMSMLAGCGNSNPPPRPRETVPTTAAEAPKPEAPPVAPAQDYPASRRDDVVEQLHGTAVHDPYRWLEDPSRPE